MAKLTPGSNIDLGEVASATGGDPFIPLRAASVEAYAALESSLSTFFALLLGTSQDKSNIVFYRVVNTRSRNTIITKLMRKQFGAEYDVLWNSLLKLIRKIDERRNQIIHWHIVANISATEDGNTAILSLSPPGQLLEPGEPEALWESDLTEFIHQTDFVSRLLNMFHLHHMRPPGPLPAPWPDIFRQAASYPPSQDHPLIQQ